MMAALTSDARAQREPEVRAALPPRVSCRARSRYQRAGIEAPEPAIARPPAGQHGLSRRCLRQRDEPPCGCVLGHPLRDAQDSIGDAIAIDDGAIPVETFLETEPPVEDLLHDAPALDAEVEGGPYPLGRERQALPRGIAHGEEPAHGGAEEPVREIGAVIRGAHGAAVAQEALEGGLELGQADVGPEADQAALTHGKDPAEAARDQPAIEPEIQAFLGDVRVRLE